MIRYILSASTFTEVIILLTSFMLAILLAIVLHEVAHGYAALINGDTTAKRMGRLSLNPVAHFNLMGFLMLFVFGVGYANPVPVNPYNFKNYKKGMIMVSVAGVLANLLLAFLLYPLFGLITDVLATGFWAYVIYWLQHFLYYFIIININLALFNLLPFAPLDGFNILASLTPSNNRLMVFLRKYSSFILLFLILIRFVPFIRDVSLLDLYIYRGQTVILNIISWFWGLLGL